MSSPLRIGTRGSRLALWQAQHIAELLQPSCPAILVQIETAGDQRRDLPLAQLGGEGLFTKEIQRALLEERIDVAVHSLKDLPTVPVQGLVLAAVPPRGPAGDVFVSERFATLEALPGGAAIGTSSPRRRAQLLHRRPDLRIVSVRGNVETRLRKLNEQNLDALILAQAGLERLGLETAAMKALDPSWMLPAVGQGALGVECRETDVRTRALLEHLNDPCTYQAVTAERSVLRALGGGCQVPIGALARIENNEVVLRCAVLDPDGKRRIEGEIIGSVESAEEIGRALGRDLLARGARELLSATEASQGAPAP
jgi:hydroxymethylbilane synthase